MIQQLGTHVHFSSCPAIPEHWLVLAASSGLRNVATPVVTDVLLTKVPGLPQSIEIDQRLDKKFRQDFTGALVVARENENTQEVPLLSCLLGREFVPFMG